MLQSIEKNIIERIYGNGRGWVFFQSDFSDFGSPEAIHLALHRLARKSTIRRVIRGFYDYPRYSELLKKPMGPNIHQVARAMARKFGWQIYPGGPVALNLIGLSTQIPSKYLYHSDGPDRKYVIGQTTLAFKHVALKEAGFRHDASGIIVQALKALGEAHITDEVIERVRAWLPVGKRAAVLKDTQRVTGWVYAAIKRICREELDG